MQISELEYLVLIIILILFNLYSIWKYYVLRLSKKAEIEAARRDTADRQRSIIKGGISEIIAPWSLDCVNSAKELRFIGSPIDFVGFKGLDGDETIDIIFLEVKSGKSRLNSNQRRIKDAVNSKRIEWAEVRISDLEIEEN